LSELNEDRKVAGEPRPPIGVDRNLSGSELLHRNSIWPRFKAAKKEGKECRWQMGYRLYVDGLEVLPDMTT